jgi:hypothetical protein
VVKKKYWVAEKAFLFTACLNNVQMVEPIDKIQVAFQTLIATPENVMSLFQVAFKTISKKQMKNSQQRLLMMGIPIRRI